MFLVPDGEAYRSVVSTASKVEVFDPNLSSESIHWCKAGLEKTTTTNTAALTHMWFMCMAFSSHARIMGECSVNQSPPALSFFFSFFKVEISWDGPNKFLWAKDQSTVAQQAEMTVDKCSLGTTPIKLRENHSTCSLECHQYCIVFLFPLPPFSPAPSQVQHHVHLLWLLCGNHRDSFQFWCFG